MKKVKNSISKQLDKLSPNRDWHIIGATLRALGEISALTLLFHHLIPEKLSTLSWWQLSAFWSVFIFLVLAFIVNAYAHIKEKRLWGVERRKMARDAKFARVMHKINRGFSDTHKILRVEMEENNNYLRELIEALKKLHETIKDDEAFKNTFISMELSSLLSNGKPTSKSTKASYLVALEKFCGDISEVFTEIIVSHTGNTNAKCAVCIKPNLGRADIKSNDENKVFTLIRDRNSSDRYEYDDVNKARYYKKNTAYRDIWDRIINQKRDKYFFSNSLPMAIDKGYENESFKDNGVDVDYLKSLTIEERREHWPLKYRSAIVAPIFIPSFDGSEKDGLLGFLCLDCDAENVFNEDSDTPLLMGCAEGIFNITKRFQEKFSLPEHSK
ncbi:MAG: hypothetical protein IPP32_03260 [Bacteroidetes bacterium]|nr:hypothetical protein [Bacteroidota bacterium]